MARRAANLLSREFLQLVRPHLKPGGILFYNTTNSNEVYATGVDVYPYALRVGNFLAVSDSKIVMDKQRWREILTHYEIDDLPLFNLDIPAHRARLEEVLSLCDSLDRPPMFYTLEDENLIRARTRGARLITDDNMGTEWDPQVHGAETFR